MITGPDLTAEQRAKLARSYRLSAISGVVFAVAFMIIGLVEVLLDRGTARYVTIGLSLLWLILSWVNWSRFRKFSN